jgi:hypothetical protein
LGSLDFEAQADQLGSEAIMQVAAQAASLFLAGSDNALA